MAGGPAGTNNKGSLMAQMAGQAQPWTGAMPWQQPATLPPATGEGGRPFVGMGNDNGDPIRREGLDKMNAPWREPLRNAMPFGMMLPQMAPGGTLPGQLNPQTLPGMLGQQAQATAPVATPAPTPAPAAPQGSVTPATPDAYTYQGGHQVPTTPGAVRQVGEVLQPGDMAGVPEAERHLYYFDPETYTYTRGR